MKTVKITATLNIGYHGAEHREEFEVELGDNAKVEDMQDEIDEMVQDWANNYIEINWFES